MYYFKMSGWHPDKGNDTRYLATDYIDEVEDWSEEFTVDECFYGVTVTKINEQEYNEAIATKTFAEKLLADVGERISFELGRAKRYNSALVDIKSSADFRRVVTNTVFENINAYQDLPIEKAVESIMELYVDWKQNDKERN